MRETLVVTMALSLLAGTAPAAPILNEVYYDAVGPDSPFVFTELFGCPGTSLDGWSLVGVNGSSGTRYRAIDLTGGVVPDDGNFVIATASASLALASVRDFIGNVDWQNGPDAVLLLNALGSIIDSLQYGDAGAGNSGEGDPAVDAAAGLSLSRDSWGTDTDDNAADFLAQTPTPGIGVSLTNVAEPSTFGLLLIGLWTTVRHGRSRDAAAAESPRRKVDS